jgi:translation initiation factor 2 subunit 1
VRTILSAEIVEQPIPDDGELVLATVRQISPHGVYVTLDEYKGMPAFLHVSEITTGWVRNIDKYAKPGQKIVLKVIRVSKARKEVDLSLRQVTGEERKEKLLEVKKAEKVRTIFEHVKARLNLTGEEPQKLAQTLDQEFGGVYDGLEEIARKGQRALAKLQLPEDKANALLAVVQEKITIPVVEVRGVCEIKVTKPDGINIIKKAFAEVEQKKSSGVEVSATYLGSPRYRLVVRAENFKSAEKTLQNSIEKIKSFIEKNRGSFSFSREESRKKSSIA